MPLRAGSDIVFLGGLVNYVLTNGLEFRDYIVPYTNAANIVGADFTDAEDLDGLFSGWDPGTGTYAPDSWAFEETGPEGHDQKQGGHTREGSGKTPRIEHARRDDTLADPRCVFQILTRHFARYTPALVESECGVPREAFLRAADVFCHASGPDKTAAICYAVGWTQHSVGVQIIRTAAILQLLLGNIGRPGGGILALRGHASIQGSTDIPTLYDILPGYLPMPTCGEDGRGLERYVEKHRLDAGGWHAIDAYLVSLLKAWYGDAATAGNDYGFDWLPRTTGDHSHLGYWLDMADATGTIEGLFVMGQNPAVGAPNARLERKALANLRWLVVRDLVESETATFWLDSSEVRRGELRTADIATEVFFFPAAAHAEKDGCFTNTQRLLQWHERAVDPPGDARSDGWFVYHLGARLKTRAANDAQPRNAGLRALTWNYSLHGPHQEPSIAEVLREINGRRCSDGRLLEGFHELAADGATACGCWIYSGVHPEPAQSRSRAAAERPVRTRLGICVAGGSTDPLQPRVGAARRPAVERAQAAGVVGSRRRRVDRIRHARLPPRSSARVQAGGRSEGRCRDQRHVAVHHARRRARMALGGKRTEGWSAARALRTFGVARRQRGPFTADQPRGGSEGSSR